MRFPPDAARLPDPVLLAVEERLLWRVYDCDLLDGIATGILLFRSFSRWLSLEFTVRLQFLCVLQN
jgi:hypothetical protein